MKLKLALLAVFFLLPTIVFADAKSDFEYQYTKYRDSYLEFSVYKRDYLSTPSLDNQQKVLLSLKQSLISRDLTKASLARYLIDLITVDKVVYDPLNSIVQSLDDSYLYFNGKANEAQSVVTLENLKDYDLNYSQTSLDSEKALKLGIVAHKIAKLIHLQDQSTKAMETLKYKLPDSISIRVKERVAELDQERLVINQKIDELMNYLLSKEGQESIQSPIFFGSRVDKLSEIRTLQLNWIDKLIDLDLNYGKI